MKPVKDQIWSQVRVPEMLGGKAAYWVQSRVRGILWPPGVLSGFVRINNTRDTVADEVWEFGSR